MRLRVLLDSKSSFFMDKTEKADKWRRDVLIAVTFASL